ncbi:hypothetical protein JCM3765_001065 [Sporobolomyces pararoseus]
MSTRRGKPTSSSKVRSQRKEVVHEEGTAQNKLFEGVPREYIIDVLKELAPRLIAGINCISIPSASTPNDNEPPPKVQSCIFTPSKRSEESPFPPDCFVALTFPPSPSQPTRLLVPAHSIIYSLLDSPCFPLVPPPSLAAPSNPTKHPSFELNLPVLGPFALASYRSFVTLHSYLHYRSSAQLLRSLLLPSIASAFSPPSPPPSSTLTPSFAHSPSNAQDRIIEEQQLKQLYELRSTGAVLELADDTFWTTLQRAYEVVMHRST